MAEKGANQASVLRTARADVTFRSPGLERITLGKMLLSGMGEGINTNYMFGMMKTNGVALIHD